MKGLLLVLLALSVFFIPIMALRVLLDSDKDLNDSNTK